MSKPSRTVSCPRSFPPQYCSSMTSWTLSFALSCQIWNTSVSLQTHQRSSTGNLRWNSSITTNSLLSAARFTDRLSTTPRVVSGLRTPLACMFSQWKAQTPSEQPDHVSSGFSSTTAPTEQPNSKTRSLEPWTTGCNS
eukprot:PhF_6_TR26696/c0_g1_i1/m.38945